MHIDEGTDNNEGAEHIPQPEISGADRIVDTSSCKLCTKSVGHSVIPYGYRNTEGKPGEYEGKQQERHCSFAVVFCRYKVKVVRNTAEYYYTVYTKGNKG